MRSSLYRLEVRACVYSSYSVFVVRLLSSICVGGRGQDEDWAEGCGVPSLCWACPLGALEQCGCARPAGRGLGSAAHSCPH